MTDADDVENLLRERLANPFLVLAVAPSASAAEIERQGQRLLAELAARLDGARRYDARSARARGRPSWCDRRSRSCAIRRARSRTNGGRAVLAAAAHMTAVGSRFRWRSGARAARRWAAGARTRGVRLLIWTALWGTVLRNSARRSGAWARARSAPARRS
jgi:hypothetical protein